MSMDVKYTKILEKDYIEIKPIGEVDIYTSPDFKNKIIDLIETKEKSIIINAEQLDYIDSTGLGALMSIFKKIKEKQLDIKIINLKPNIYKLFDITGLNKIFNIQQGRV